MVTIVLEKAQKIEREVFKGLNSLISIKVYNGGGLPYGSIQIQDKKITSSTIQQYKNTIDTIVLCDSLIEIEKGAFENCSSLTTVELPNNIERIGKEVFKDCDQLSSVEFLDSTIPKGMITEGVPMDQEVDPSTASTNKNIGRFCSMGEGIFSNCTSLTNLILSNHIDIIGAQSFYNCSKLKIIKLSDKLRKIEPYTFLDCVALEEVEIGKNIELIDNGAFDNCNSLKTITIETENPPQIKGNFSLNSSVKIYVPNNKIVDYQCQWGAYRSQIEGLSSKP